MRNELGFSLVETLLALAILLIATAPLLHVTASGQQLARSQSEATDLHQRVRVAAARLRADIAAAGTGSFGGPFEGSLSAYFAPLIPARVGLRAPDPMMTVSTDRITVVFVPDGAWSSALIAPMTAATDPLVIDDTAPGCPQAGVCGFTEGTRALVVDASALGAAHDVFTVTGIAGGLAHDSPNPPFGTIYSPPGSYVVPVVQRTYHFDRPTRRLMVYDGYRTDMPLIDDVVDVRFSYFADGSASSVVRPASGIANCVYAAGTPPVPRLSERDEQVTLLPPAEMVDGPICGSGAHAFDGDLLRIRLVRITVRLQAALDDLRGASALFARPGHSSSAFSSVPDFEVTFDVAPRNMTPIVFPR